MEPARRLIVYSTKGAPGVTTLSLGLARSACTTHGRVLLADLDMDGGALAVGLGMRFKQGVPSLAAELSTIQADTQRPSWSTLYKHTVDNPLIPNMRLLCGIWASFQSGYLDICTPIIQEIIMAQQGMFTIQDMGRLRRESLQPLFKETTGSLNTACIVVTNGQLSDAMHIRQWAQELSGNTPTGIVINRDAGPQVEAELSAACELPVWGRWGTQTKRHLFEDAAGIWNLQSRLPAATGDQLSQLLQRAQSEMHG